MEKMAKPELTPSKRFTYRDYRSWPDDERWELIGGQAWAMSPAPTRAHQGLSMRLSALMSTFLEGRSCEVYAAPFDVLLPAADEADDEVDTVVQPDIAVFCDRGKLTPAGARGAPDLVVEILSPSTSKRDLSDKFELYERHGVREYWVVDPGNRAIQLWRLGADARFEMAELRDLARDDSPIASSVLDGFAIEPKALFRDLD
jgi:Uma2 family endonuclease